MLHLQPNYDTQFGDNISGAFRDEGEGVWTEDAAVVVHRWQSYFFLTLFQENKKR